MNKLLKLKNFLWLFLLTLSFGAHAVTVDGHVYFGEDAPAPGVEVLLSNANEFLVIISDDEGYFAADFSASTGLVQVSVVDICTGEIILQTVDLAADFTTVDFHICGDIDPPVDSLCAAGFTYQQIDADLFTIEFTDLSFSADDIVSWTWDFGDGSVSEEQNPTHTYAEIGLYEVSLIINSPACSSTFVDIVEVRDGTWCNCPDFWDPVCVASPEGDTITFSNLCFAECEGFTYEDVFVCDADSTCICPDIWDPICVEDANGNILSFGNPCEAECEGFTVEDFVECDGGCDCPDVWEPVCIQVPDDPTQEPLLFPSLCIAECAGFTEDMVVDCDSTGCNCPDEWDPVCVETEDGYVITFSNLCEAECEGFTEDDIVDCVDPCICDDVWDPVCVMTLDSIRYTFSNICEAECAGFTADDIVDCEPDCNCPDVWEPVCIATPFPGGGTIQFQNACFAECEGFTPDMFVDCDSTGCICPEYYAPVCVTLPDGSVLTFDNECFAECAGYTDYIYCDGNPETNCFASFYMETPFDSINPISNAFQFTDQSWTQEGEIISWSWDFGDGETSTEQNPYHEYAEEGVYVIVLTIESSTGCTSVYEDHICIGNGGFIDDYDCQAMFFFEQIDGTSYNFQDFSFGTPTSWSWDFGDGNVSEEQNPSHTYESAGIYIVNLTITTDNCESSSSMLIAAGENVDYENDCFALFIPIFADDNPFFIDSLGFEGVLFLNLSSSPDGTALWDFGDGTTSTDFMPFHNYTENGTYEVTLTITSTNGCTNSFSATVNITSNEFLGSPQYSLTTATPKVETAIQKVTAYPNPTTNDVNIKFTLPQAGDYSLQILDINSRLLNNTTQSGVAGMNIKTVKTNNLENGMYFIKIISGQSSASTKIIKN